jgi:sec-independent protein translocase protein TatB
MFEVGFTEILLIFAIALLVLGPARLPKLAADVGRWAGRARSMARQLRTQLEQEVHFDPLADAPKSAQTIHTPAPAQQPSPAPASSPAELEAAAPAVPEAVTATMITEPAVAMEAPAASDGTDEPKPK